MTGKSIAGVRQVFALLDAVGSLRDVSTQALADKVGLPSELTRRMMEAMARQGYAVEVQGRWTLHPRLFELGAQALKAPDLVEVATPSIRALGAAVGEAVELGVMDDGSVVCLQKLDSELPLGLCVPIGHRTAARQSAIGKVLRAWRSGEAAGDARELAVVRAQGFAELRSTHVHSFAAAIFDQRREAVAGIAIHVPAVRVREAWLRGFVPDLLLAAHAISEGLGCSPATTRWPQSGTTAVTSISTLARSSISADT